MLRNPGLRKSVEQPVLDLNFAASQIGSNGAPDGRMNDFNRGSNAWFVDSDGLVKKSPHNLQVYSQDFDNAAWSKSRVTVSANAITAPDGTLTADKIVETAESGAKYWRDFASAVTGERFFFSVFAKAAERKYLQMWTAFGTGGNWPEVWNIFDVEAGTVIRSDSDGDSATIEDVGNGWFRCTTSITADGTGLDDIGFGLWDGVGSIPTTSVSYTGDGSSGLFVWGAQFSQHTTLPVDNPYIKTEGSAVYAARLDHDPAWFMSAAQEQNLFEYSEMLDDSAWTKTILNVTANAETDPLGGTTAEYLYASSPSGVYPFIQGSFDAKKGAVHTVSFYAKAGEIDVVTINIRKPDGTYIAAPIENQSLTSEWQRFSGTFTANEDSHIIRLYFGSGAKTWTGDQGFYIWGTQIEVGSTASTYHRTEGQPYYGEGATPRGLLIEEARTNLVDDSEDFSAASWSGSGVTVTGNDVLAPDGTTTGTKLVATSTNAILSDSFTKAASAKTYTATLFAKTGDEQNITLTIDDGNSTNRGRVVFDITDGSVSSTNDDGDFTNTSGSVEDFGNGWYRLRVTTTTNTGTSLRHRFFFTDFGTDTCFVWGAQLEEGSFPTSYIQTTGSSATRNADVATMGPTTGGTELVTNGTFDTDSDWVVTAAASITGGELVYSSAGQFKNTDQIIAGKFVAGRRYRFSCDVTSYTSGTFKVIYLEGSTNQGDVTSTSTGAVTFDFTCVDDNPGGGGNRIRLQSFASSNNTFAIDNVSVRELYPFEQYNPAEGTVLVEATQTGEGSSFASVAAIVQNGSHDNDLINIYRSSSNDRIQLAIKSGGTLSADIGLSNARSLGTAYKFAGSYLENSASVSLDGLPRADNTSATIPAVDQILFYGDVNFQGNEHSGYIKRFQYYKRKLDKVTLQSLTSD